MRRLLSEKAQIASRPFERRTMQDVEGFLKAAREVADEISNFIDEGANILIVGHNDADALAGLGVFAGALSEEGAWITVRSIQRIDEFMSSYNDGDYELVVFIDMGSGYLKELSECVKKAKLVILDHHKPTELKSWSGLLHLNPHIFGIDGTVEISASGVSYLVARELSEEAKKYAPIAIVGALGDLQDKDGGRRLRGLNKSIVVKDALELGLLSVKEDLILHGRSFRPVHQALASTYSPFVPGLTGNESTCLHVVVSAGIEVRNGEFWRTLADLSEDEKKALYNSIIAHLASNGYPTSIASELIGEVYELTVEEEWTNLRDAREFATLLNACGKSGNAWIGIAIAMGKRGWVLEEGQRVLEEYRQAIGKAMEYATRPGVLEHMRHVVVLRGGDAIDVKQVSSIASVFSSSQLVPQDKPLIALAQEGNLVKVSARASSKLVEAGLDLGFVMHEAAKAFGGRGGGHKVAAGAEIQADRLTLFLVEVDRLVGELVRQKQGTIQRSLDEL